MAGGPGAISEGLRELGVESTLLVFNERPFERGFDVNLELRDTSRMSSVPFNLPKQLRALRWALREFDVFHFHAGLTLAPRRITLPLLRRGARESSSSRGAPTCAGAAPRRSATSGRRAR